MATSIKMDEKEEEKEGNIESKPTRIRMYEQIEMQLQTLRNGEGQELQDQRKAHEKELAHVRDTLKSEHEAHIEKLIRDHENAMKKVKQQLEELSAASFNRAAPTNYKALLKRLSVFKGPSIEYKQSTEREIDGNMSKNVTNESYRETSDKFEDDDDDGDNNGVDWDSKGIRGAAEGDQDGPSVDRDDQGPSEGEGSMGTDPVDTVDGETKDALEHSDKESVADSDIVIYQRKKLVERGPSGGEGFVGTDPVDTVDRETKDALEHSDKESAADGDIVIYQRKKLVEREMVDYKKRFLGDILKANHVDVKEKDIRDMQACVHDVLWNSVKSDPDVCEVILCGSMAEGTRIWEYERYKHCGNMYSVPVVEFDFLAVFNWKVTMNKDTQAGELRVKDGPYPGYKRVKPDKSSSIFRRSPGEFEIECLKRFRKHVLKNICGTSRLALEKKQADDHSIEYQFIWEPFGLKPTATYKDSQRDTLEDTCLINVDFMPAFRYQEPNEEPNEEPKEACPCLLVPKREPRRHIMPAFRYEARHEEMPFPRKFLPLFEYPKLDEESQFLQQLMRPFHELERERYDESHWYLLHSYCREEIQTLIDTSQVHRDVFMLLKSFNKHIGMDAMPAYHFKTAVLRHIEKCQEPDLVDCSRDSLQFLNKCYSQGELLTLRGQINLLERETNVVEKRITQVPLTILHAFEQISNGMSDDKEYNFETIMNYFQCALKGEIEDASNH